MFAPRHPVVSKMVHVSNKLKLLIFNCWFLKNSDLGNQMARQLDVILLKKLLWPTVRKIVLVIEKNFWNSRLKAENLQYFLDHYYKGFVIKY